MLGTWHTYMHTHTQPVCVGLWAIESREKCKYIFKLVPCKYAEHINQQQQQHKAKEAAECSHYLHNSVGWDVCVCVCGTLSAHSPSGREVSVTCSLGPYKYKI